MSYLRVWGCLAFYKALDPKRSKLGPRRIKSIFVGYAENSKAYKLLNLDSNTIVESRDVEFIENKFYNDHSSEIDYNEVPLSNVNPSSFQSEKRKQPETVIETEKSQRVRKEKTLDPYFISSQSIVFLVEADRNKIKKKIGIVFNIDDDPKSLSEALASRDAAFWKEAIDDEMHSLMSN